MKHTLRRATISAIVSLVPYIAMAQAMFFGSAKVDPASGVPELQKEAVEMTPLDSLRLQYGFLVPDSVMEPYETVVGTLPLPRYFFGPSVYNKYEFPEPVKMTGRDLSGEDYMIWIEEEKALHRKMDEINYNLFFNNPQVVQYNVRLLPEAPKVYQAVVNPEDHTIEIQEKYTANDVNTTISSAPLKKRHWIRAFNASLQFSQAYVSPNWYQGGNNNLNMIANIFYNVKLNQKYHPNLIFETTAQYKLGMNSAPDDTVHSYNISEDLFQINTTFGVKAAKKWYYSFTGQFKTQLLNSYKSNSHDLRSAFLSPAELTAGIGMTYNHSNAKGTFTFDASIAPISYNMRICTNENIDETIYDIDEGHKTAHKFGSSAEIKLKWKMARNITLNSRIFAFTDYGQAQADWENTIDFDINRFLSTRLYVHARYDSTTARVEDSKWHHFQVKEILSIGFSYKFSSI